MAKPMEASPASYKEILVYHQVMSSENSSNRKIASSRKSSLYLYSYESAFSENVVDKVWLKVAYH